jgi:hypothetical protein
MLKDFLLVNTILLDVRCTLIKPISIPEIVVFARMYPLTVFPKLSKLQSCSVYLDRMVSDPVWNLQILVKLVYLITY